MSVLTKPNYEIKTITETTTGPYEKTTTVQKIIQTRGGGLPPTAYHPNNPNLLYWPPEPRNTFRVNPLALKSLKNLDVDELQDCFGRSIQNRRNYEFSKKTEIEKVFDRDDEINAIKHTINQAKLNRDRAHQIHEWQARRLQNIVKDAEMDEKVLENLESEKQAELDKLRKHREDMLQAKYILQKQMADKIKAQEESKKEYERDKQQINEIMQKIRDEDKAAYEDYQRKKAIAKQYMDNAYAEKAELKRKAKEDERIQKEKERKYFEDVARRELEHQMKQKALQDSKDKRFEKLCADKAREQAEKDYWEDVRNQLYDEENDRRNRIKELEEKEKQQRQKEEMLACAIEQMKRKEEIKKQEEALENEFKKKLFEKFAEDERQERLNFVRRKQKMKEFQDDIERQWRLKLEQYKKQKEQELRELEYNKRLEEERRKLIEKEKERLIRENEELLKNYYVKGYYNALKYLHP